MAALLDRASQLPEAAYFTEHSISLLEGALAEQVREAGARAARTWELKAHTIRFTPCTR